MIGQFLGLTDTGNATFMCSVVITIGICVCFYIGNRRP